MAKKRIDLLLVEEKKVQTRSRAQDLIKREKVFFNGKLVKKGGELFSVEEIAKIEIRERDELIHGAGRGQLKLEEAIKTFHLHLRDLVCLDVGASTGGFTQVMLAEGAKRVHAIDVGHNQMMPSLKEDPRVKNYEGINARYDFVLHEKEKVDFISMDLSFISLRLVLSSVLSHLKEEGEIVMLFKPQFELGASFLGKGGVVIHPHLEEEYPSFLEEFVVWAQQEHPLTFMAHSPSPIKGKEGNCEFLLYFKKKG